MIHESLTRFVGSFTARGNSKKAENSNRLSEELKTRSVHDTIIDEAKITLSTIQHASLPLLTPRESREAEPSRLHSLADAMELSKTEEKAMDALVNLAFGSPTLQTHLASLTEAQKEGAQGSQGTQGTQGSVKRDEPEELKGDEAEGVQESAKEEKTEEEKTEEEEEEDNGKEKQEGWR